MVEYYKAVVFRRTEKKTSLKEAVTDGNGEDAVSHQQQLGGVQSDHEETDGNHPISRYLSSWVQGEC
jgi:hypothetical protein